MFLVLFSETLIEKFRPDMRMLSVASYAVYELHSHEERKLAGDEKPLLVQLNWHIDDREGRFLLKDVAHKTVSSFSGHIFHYFIDIYKLHGNSNLGTGMATDFICI